MDGILNHAFHFSDRKVEERYMHKMKRIKEKKNDAIMLQRLFTKKGCLKSNFFVFFIFLFLTESSIENVSKEQNLYWTVGWRKLTGTNVDLTVL